MNPTDLMIRPRRVRTELLPPGISMHLPMVDGNWRNGFRYDQNTSHTSYWNPIVGYAAGAPHLGGASTHFELGNALENAGTYTSTNSAWASSAHMTFGVWIRLNSMDSAGSTIMSRGNIDATFSNRCFWFHLNPDYTIRLRYFTGTSSRILDTTATVGLNRWHHIVWVARPSTTGDSKIYLDGVEVASGSMVGNMNVANRQPAIGMLRQNNTGTTWHTTTRFHGDMAHAYFYRRDISGDEASKLYVATHPGF